MIGHGGKISGLGDLMSIMTGLGRKYIFFLMLIEYIERLSVLFSYRKEIKGDAQLVSLSG